MLAAVAIGGVAIVLLTFAFGRYFYRIRHSRREDANIFLENAANWGVIFAVLWWVVALAALIWLNVTKSKKLPDTVVGVNAKTMNFVADALWVLDAGAVCLYQYSLGPKGRRAIELYKARNADEEARGQSEMAAHPPIVTTSTLPQGAVNATGGRRPRESESSRRRSGSDTMSSIRLSISNAVRPMSSKTRLVGYKSPKQRGSLESSTGERDTHDDGFDSWDTSAVETPAWRSVMQSSEGPTPMDTSAPPRILETIPASPTTSSRAPSPGNPLDLPAPPFGHRRSRSQSPNRPGVTSPGSDEAHVHPLFRSNSLTPPPTVSNESVITAVRSPVQTRSSADVRRNRSGSMPAPSPLSNSVQTFEKDNRRVTNGKMETPVETPDESVLQGSTKTSSSEERAMTPPIPDWVLVAIPRSEKNGYARGKESLERSK